ncbi:MAG: Gldg family protein [Candidatus Wallbacteria bacterium]|nr:Gldg family protein [Candidatus Wallbacteria bacterium]
MDFKDKKKNQYNIYLSTVILLCFLGIANYLCYHKFFRVDLTSEKLYSLSAPTKKILTQLDDIISIKCFFSANLPPAYKKIEDQVRDLLSEYKAYGGSHLNIEFCDPKDDPKYRQLAESLGVPEIQMNVLEKDQVQAIKGYLGMGIYFEDKSTALPVVNELGNLEYEITSGIKRVTCKKLPEIRVALFENESDQSIMEKYQELVKALGKLAKVSFLNLSREEIPADLDLLILLYPKETSEAARFKIDQYLASGGKAIFLIQVLEPNQMMYGTLVEHNMAKILNQLGMKVEYKLVYDRSSDFASFRNGYITFTQPYPLFIKIAPYYFAKDLPLFNQISSITLPWVAAVQSTLVNTAEAEIKSLFTSTEYNQELNGFSLDPQQNFLISEKQSDKKMLGAVFTGKYKTCYDHNSLTADIVAGYREKNPAVNTSEIKIKSSAEVRVAVIPDALFVSDDFLPRHEGNLAFLQNTVDWLTLGEDLMQIRAKNVSEHPLFSREAFQKYFKEGKDEEIQKIKFRLKYLNMFGVSILVMILGVIWYLLRERRRIDYEKKYSGREE